MASPSGGCRVLSWARSSLRRKLSQHELQHRRQRTLDHSGFAVIDAVGDGEVEVGVPRQLEPGDELDGLAQCAVVRGREAEGPRLGQDLER